MSKPTPQLQLADTLSALSHRLAELATIDHGPTANHLLYVDRDLDAREALEVARQTGPAADEAALALALVDDFRQRIVYEAGHPGNWEAVSVDEETGLIQWDPRHAIENIQRLLREIYQRVCPKLDEAAAGLRVHAPPSGKYSCRRAGEVYLISYDGESGAVDANLKGAIILEKLLSTPNTQHDASALLALGADYDASRADNLAGELQGGNDKPAGPVAEDWEAKEAAKKLKERLDDIEGERDKLKADGAMSDAAEERLEREKQAISKETSRLLGRHGRPRPSGAGEANRVNVYGRLGTVKKSLGKRMPRFVEHLKYIDGSGGKFSYRPPKPAPDWQF